MTLTLLSVAIILAGLATLFILELWLADRIIPGIYVWDGHASLEQFLGSAMRETIAQTSGGVRAVLARLASISAGPSRSDPAWLRIRPAGRTVAGS